MIIVVTWGGTAYAWDSPQILATLIAGCVGLGLCGIYEWLVVTEGTLDHRLFQSRNFPILIFVCVKLLLGVNVFFAQEIPVLFAADPVQIRIVMTPYIATSAFFMNLCWGLDSPHQIVQSHACVSLAVMCFVPQ